MTFSCRWLFLVNKIFCCVSTKASIIKCVKGFVYKKNSSICFHSVTDKNLQMRFTDRHKRHLPNEKISSKKNAVDEDKTSAINDLVYHQHEVNNIMSPQPRTQGALRFSTLRFQLEKTRQPWVRGCMLPPSNLLMSWSKTSEQDISWAQNLTQAGL